MSGSRPIPTPVPAAETAAAWSRDCGQDWVTREDDSKLFQRRVPRGLQLPAREEGQSESERVIRALERQINGGRDLSPPYQPRRHHRPAPYHEQHQVPEPVSGEPAISEPTNQTSHGKEG